MNEIDKKVEKYIERAGEILKDYTLTFIKEHIMSVAQMIQAEENYQSKNK